MKFRKKATECELIQFQPEGTPGSPDDLVLKHRVDGTHAVRNELHASDIKLEAGDFINVTTPGDYFPIKKAVVDRDYEKLAAAAPHADAYVGAHD